MRSDTDDDHVLRQLTRAQWRRKQTTGISYEHPVAFWCGVVTVTIGVMLQLPMYYMARMNHYRLAGMPITPEMAVGMVMIFVGIAATIRGLFPRGRLSSQESVSRITVATLDDAPITRAHVGLLIVLAIAITIDVMKPTTLAFVAPGAAAEYGLRSPLNPHAHALSIALYPLCALAGLVPGSFIWGWLGDRIGRRASILIAAVIFVATSTCGAMPAYWLNLVTCFVMGLGVGGMLPIAFTLMSEVIPARHRGWLMVLIGGDIACAYIITSWLASTLAAPDRFGWRILWLVGLPTGLLLLVLNRWIPESPRFLLRYGREEEARNVMARYGVAIVEAEADADLAAGLRLPARFTQLLNGPFAGLTAMIVLLALGIGVTQYGFQQWMPSNLQHLGYTAVNSSEMLRDSALIGFPLSFPIALLYGFWSSKKMVILMVGATLIALVGFVIAGTSVTQHPALLRMLLVVPVWGIGILNSVLAVYTAEIYPTLVRARGSGMSAAATKLGGFLVLVPVAASIAIPSVKATAMLGALPLALAVIAVVIFGPETRRKRLERITAEEVGRP